MEMDIDMMEFLKVEPVFVEDSVKQEKLDLESLEEGSKEAEKPMNGLRIRVKSFKTLSQPRGRRKRTADEQRARANERVRKYRANLSEERKEEIRAKERERNQKRKEAGLLKTIDEMSPQEQRAMRKRWRESSRRHRLRLANASSETGDVAQDPLAIESKDKEEHNPVENQSRTKQGPKKRKGKKDIQTKLREARALILKLQKEKRTLQRRVFRMEQKIEKLERYRYSKESKLKKER